VGECIYCHKSAGWFRDKHKGCEARHERATNWIVTDAKHAMRSSGDLSALQDFVLKLAADSYIAKTELSGLLVRAWESAVEAALEDGVLTSEEETALVHAQQYFNWTQNDLNGKGTYSRLAEAGVLRDVLEGKPSTRLRVEGQLPFNFQKGEHLVWLFPDVKYYEVRTRRTYVGGYQGASIRVARGVYYRLGGFRGTPIDSPGTVHADTGAFAVTDTHLYFAGQAKSFRIRYDKIVSFTPYSDGIGLQRDAVTAKPQAFLTGHGWFAYNLVVNLANLQAGRIPAADAPDSGEQTPTDSEDATT